MSLDLTRFHQTFFEESREGLDAMEAALLKLDIDNTDAETINLIFRAAHSIKGGAGTFGFSGIADFTHGVETLLDRIRSGARKISQADVDLLLRTVDGLRSLLAAASDGAAVDATLIGGLHNEIQAALSGVAAKAAAPVQAAAEAAVTKGWRIRFAPKPELFRSGNDPMRILQELQTLGHVEAELDTSSFPSLEHASPEDCYLAWNLRLDGNCPRAQVEEVFAWVEDECELRIEAIEPPKQEKPKLTVVQGGREPAAEAKPHGDGGSIRVGTEKIDALINLVGELVITQSMLAQIAGALDPVTNEKLLNGLSQLDRNTRMLQEAVMATRMLPMDFVFSRFPRVVRDLAAKLGKQVRLNTSGENTELDKGVIERIADPLNHLVRNALDHGLESPEERRAANKDETGSITLRAAHQGGHILIEIADDGRGLDRGKLLKKAQEKGLACSESMTDGEVWNLIFAPGFSTAAVVTDVSGRGVGMDVVKKNIQALGGQVEIVSRAGQGMTVIIRLPLTLAILDGMSVRVGEEIFIVPLNSVVESLQPTPEQVKPVAGRGRVVKVRNDYLPLVALHQTFRLPSQHTEPHKGIVVLMESEGRKIAALVDELVGQQQVVIKSLEANYRRVHGISGATILGDGRVALILDVAALVRDLHQPAAA